MGELEVILWDRERTGELGEKEPLPLLVAFFKKKNILVSDSLLSACIRLISVDLRGSASCDFLFPVGVNEKLRDRTKEKR